MNFTKFAGNAKVGGYRKSFGMLRKMEALFPLLKGKTVMYKIIRMNKKLESKIILLINDIFSDFSMVMIEEPLVGHPLVYLVKTYSMQISML